MLELVHIEPPLDDLMKFLRTGLRATAQEVGLSKHESKAISVAILDDTKRRMIAGVYAYTDHNNGCFIESLYVSKEAQNKGLGRILLGEVERKATEYGCRTIYLWTSSLRAAPSFYKHMGYKVRTTLPNIPVGAEQILFFKEINQAHKPTILSWAVSLLARLTP